MDVVTRAPELIAALFPDGGAAVLREAGIGSTWREVLAHVPPELLAAPGEDPGLQQISVLRDFYARRNDFRAAIALTRALLRVHASQRGQDHPDVYVELGALGALAQRVGKAEEGAQLLERAYQALRERVGGRDLRLAVVGAHLAVHHVRNGRWQEAEVLLVEAHRIRSREAPETTAQVAAQLGEVRVHLGRDEEAASLYKEAWKVLEKQLGPEHPRVVARAWAYGLLLNKIGHHGIAIPPLRAAYNAFRGGRDMETSMHAAYELGLALDAIGQKEEGLRLIEEAIRWTRGARGPDGGPHPKLPQRLSKYASIQLHRGRPAEAEGLMREALEAERQLFGDASPEVATRYAALGYFYARNGRSAEALGWLEPAASLMRSTVGDNDPRTHVIVDYQVGLLIAQAEAALEKRDRKLAASMLRRAWSLAVPVLGYANRKTAQTRELADGLGLRLPT